MPLHYHLGKIFISHASADKGFVRSLANVITQNGFEVWLDERDLLVGDPLAEKISRGLSSAKVVIVVVSSTSINSKWLRYELNLATERMIKGHCRVIPIVIDHAQLPPEVAGLLYADCRESLDAGWPAIHTALQYEAQHAASQQGFWKRADILIEETFGSTASASVYGEYKTLDCWIVFLPVEDVDGNEVEVPYEVVSSYTATPSPLTEAWLTEYCDELDRLGKDFSLCLVVSERPIQFEIDEISSLNPRVGVRRFRMSAGYFTNMISRQVVVADFSNLNDEIEQKALLQESREMLIRCAELEKKELQELRSQHAAKIR